MKPFTLLLVLFLSACATTQSDNYTQHHSETPLGDILQQNLTIKLAYDSPLEFRGAYKKNNSVEHGAMMYDGSAGAGGFLAQIIVHAAVSSSAQKKKLTEQQQQANQILTPLQNVLGSFTQEILVHKHHHYSFSDGEDSSSIIVLESQPVFFLSQNLKAIYLKHKVLLRKQGEKDALYKNMIEVISPEIVNENPYEALQKDSGALLVEISKTLYEDSLSFAIADARGQYNDLGVTQKSFKFYQGGQLRVERGSNISEESNSDKSVIRNLRGWLVAIPNSAMKTH